MLSRVVDIAEHPAHLSTKNCQLVVTRRAPELTPTESTFAIPIEDLGVLLLDNQQTTMSQAALTRIAECGGVTVICDTKHMPTAIVLPVSKHLQNVERLREQIGMTLPNRKRTWQLIVQAKVRAQAANLGPQSNAAKTLRRMCREVRSGDPSNVEARAAKMYWADYLSTRRFVREKQGCDGNMLLDYGYAVLRAAVARALVSSGLHPALGVFHSHRSNAFCLADDLMEPLRPLVDHVARPHLESGNAELYPEIKRDLLSVLSHAVTINGERGPLLQQLRRYTASYARRTKNIDEELLIPVPVYE